MSCSECVLYIKEDYSICEEICDLLNKLGILYSLLVSNEGLS